ncbi:glucose dehydrogenase [FAD, quinone] isoform X2 [Folsomia candida]|nr:glucose dehydrogenase [FAD, quinone] isoform X2 [Folsomia candida]
MDNKVSLWPRGKLLGGTSNLNYMFYVRGNPLDYDNWANITGDERWNYDNLVAYFKKSLDYNGAYVKNEKHYGQAGQPYGYLHVEQRNEWAPLYKYFIEAVKELGYNQVDLNGPQSIGFGPSEVTQKRGSRAGTFGGFLKNFMNRENLHVSRYSQATKIKLDKNNRALGVWYTRHGKQYFARSRKEVIVSGGTVDSPKLLMLSGIGPKKHLNSIGIKTKLDLPVGKNLKDHLSVFVSPFIINETLSIILTRDFGAQALYDYFVHGYGPLTSPAILNSHGFISSKYASRKDWPDLQIYLVGLGVYSELVQDQARTLGFNATSYTEYMRPLLNQELDGFGIMATLVLPKSVGEIKLHDKNPFTPPLIDPKYLEDIRDVKTLIEGIKFSIKLVEETKSFKRLNAELFDLKFPGCEDFEPRSDLYWECFIRNVGFSLYHPVGTCRMGKDIRDKQAVVDSKLRVLWTPNLRVADASIMPKIVNCNTNAPSIMIGEVAADLIREYWSKQYLVCDYLEYVIHGRVSRQCFYSKIV